MSTLAEIQEAIINLPDQERDALSLWLDSQNAPHLSAQDEERLLGSLDEAIRDLDAGKGVPIDEVRKRLGSWVAR
jgi:hypothetical protein